jgi:CheY-like chemotaxis protein
VQNKLKFVVIIDDDNINNYICTRLINLTGLAERVQSFISAQDALDFLKEAIKTNNTSNFPDLILLDINMPVMNGWEFLEEYINLEKNFTSQVNLFMLSSSVYQEDISRAKTYKMVKDYISKPLTENTIKNLIAQIA